MTRMLLWIGLSACLLGPPHTCVSFTPPQEPVDGWSACMIRGEEMAAQWADRHPNYRIAGVTCSPERPPAKGDL